MQIPGFVWTAVLALIPLLIQWLSGDYFAGQPWVSLVVIVLGFVAKLVELYAPREDVRAGFESAYAQPKPGKVRRFLLGG
jgi:F0F1-type ATP synthase assembly protein I